MNTGTKGEGTQVATQRVTTRAANGTEIDRNAPLGTASNPCQPGDAGQTWNDGDIGHTVCHSPVEGFGFDKSR
jgi:hypothetical protein